MAVQLDPNAPNIVREGDSAFRFVCDVKPTPSGRLAIQTCQSTGFPRMSFPTSRADLLKSWGDQVVLVEVKWPRDSPPSPFELRYMPPSQNFRLKGLLASQQTQTRNRFFSEQELGSLLAYTIVSYLALEAADILRARVNSSIRLQTEFVKSFRELATPRKGRRTLAAKPARKDPQS